jgi:hypothetical protein
MDSIPALILVAEVYGQAAGLERTTVSWRLFGDSKKLDALINGSDIQTRRFEAALRWLSDNWPQSVEWPDQVRRPLSATDVVAAEARNMAHGGVDGAENPERNVSRTDEPGSSPEGATK